MPYDPTAGWIPRSAAAWRGRITTAIEDAGTEVDPEGALAGVVQGVSAIAERSDLEAQGLVQAQDPRQAVGVPLSAFAASAGAQRRAATASIATVAVAPSGAGFTYPAGYELSAPSILRGETQTRRWVVIADTTIAASPGTTNMQVRCEDTGPVTLDPVAKTAFAVVTPIGGVDEVFHTPFSGSIQVGRAAERDPSLRRRAVSERSTTLTGRLALAVGNLDWVEATSITSPGPGQVNVTIAPTPANTAQAAELVQAIADNLAPGIATTGAVSVAGVTPEGATDAETISFDVGASEVVAVAVSVTVASGYTLAGVTPEVSDAVSSAFSTLTAGETLRYADVYAAVAAVDGLTAYTLTLNGADVNVTPATAADILTPSTTVS